MLVRKLQQLKSDRLVRNIGALGIAELINRVFRLATTVTLARVFSPRDYGMVSAIYTVFEFALAFSLSAGIEAKVIQAEEEELGTVCDTAYWLSWLLCGAMFLIQCLFAYPIAQFYRSPELVLPICALGLIYLIMPNFMVNAALIDRQNRLEVKAWATSIQAILANTILVILVLRGMGVWGIVWSMVLTYPVWIIVTYRNHAWRPPKTFTIKGWQQITRFGGQVLGVELLNKVRLNVDYLIIGRVLGLEALGQYFFAFNAGLGISQSILHSLAAAWYPDFCAVRSDAVKLRQRYFKSFKAIAVTVVPLVILQTSLAYFYVPIIFGQKWIHAIPILIIICFSAIPIAFSSAASQLLLSMDKIKLDLYRNLIFTVAFTVALLAAVQYGILGVAVTVLVTQALVMPLFAVWVSRYVFSKSTIF